jgi:hypothetical protein
LVAAHERFIKSGLILSGNRKMIEQIGRRSLREYLNIEVVPTCLGRLEALEVLPAGSIESFVKSVLSYANAFMVEGFLALGTAIGIGLVAVLVRAGL